MQTQPNAQPDYPTPKPRPADLPDVGPTITGYPKGMEGARFERGFMAPPGSTPQQKWDPPDSGPAPESAPPMSTPTELLR